MSDTTMLLLPISIAIAFSICVGALYFAITRGEERGRGGNGE